MRPVSPVALLAMLALTLAVVGVLFCAPAPALAQRPETLAAALENLDYDPLRRGPLLMIAPASVSYNDGGDASYEWPDGWRATAREIAPLFGRRFENINSVNVLVPEEMAVLNPEPMPVERYAQLGRSRAFYLLLGSLTAAQWRQIGSPQGLGMESLSAEQRPLFRAVLPDPFVVKSVVASGNGGYYSYSQKHYGEGGEPPSHRLTEAQVVRARLRVTRRVSWMLEPENAPGTRMGYGVSTPRPRAEGEAFAIMESDAAPDPHETVRRALRTLAPNRPKRGDLDYASPALDARVPLDGEAKTVSDLVRRVAEATRLEVYADRRVGGLPVTVLAAPGQTARAGDLLKALAYAVTGTFRAVEGGDAGGEGPKVYLLTDDIEGIAPRRLRQIQWHADADSLTAAEQARIEEEIRQKNIAPLIGFAPDDPGALPPALVGRVEKALAENGREAAVSAADLPLPLREMVQQQIVEHARALPEAPLRPDRVYLNLNLTAHILLPGVGEFDGPPLGRLSSLLSRPANAPGAAGLAAQPEAGSTAPAGGASSAPAALPAPFAARSALLVAPTNPDEARAAVAVARSRGIARVFVAVPFGAGASGEQTARALLGAAIEAGKKEGVPVWAAVRLLRRPAAGTGNGSDSAELLPRDRNVFGETPAGFAARRGDAPDSKRVAYWGEEIAARGRWDWLCLEDEKTRAVLADELARLAAVPGLAGLVLRDVAAPGRALPPDATPGTPLLGTYLGYTPQTRVEMIRRENVDPVDLLPSNGMGGEYEESLLPFFPEERPGAASPGPRQVRDPRTGEWRSEPPAPGETLWARWGALRRDENRRHLALLGAQLKTRLPAGIPLMLGLPNPDGALFASGYALWESPEQPPRAEDRPKPGAAGERLVPVVATDRSEPGTFARNGIAALPERAAQYNGGGWNGVVLDLSALPVTKALNLLRGAMAPAALPAQR